jgi:NAD-dependent dihydropyrimidine dehydrogenase PreA subunit
MEGQGLTPPGLRPPSPTGEGKKGKKVKIVDRDACMECGACALNCKPGALTVDSGVGCAQAFINQALGRKGECCASDKCC